MSIENNTGDMIELGIALENTTGRVADMASAFGKLSKSSTEWTIISRILSGSPLWKLQNRFRAIGNIFFVLDERQKKAAESQQHFFNTVSKNATVLSNLQLTLSALGNTHDENNVKRLRNLKTYKSYISLYGRELGEKKLIEEYDKTLDRALASRFRLQKMGSKDRIKGYKEELKTLKEKSKETISGMKYEGSLGALWGQQLPKKVQRTLASAQKARGIQGKIKEIISEEESSKSRELKFAQSSARARGTPLPTQEILDAFKERMAKPTPMFGKADWAKNLDDPAKKYVPGKVIDTSSMEAIMKGFIKRRGLPPGVKRKVPKRIAKAQRDWKFGNISLTQETMKRLKNKEKIEELEKLLKNIKKAGIFGAKTYEAIVSQGKTIDEEIKISQEHLAIFKKYEEARDALKQAEINLEKAKANNKAQDRIDAQTDRQDQLQALEDIKQEMADEGLKTYEIKKQTDLLEESIKIAEKNKKENTDLMKGMENAISKMPGLKHFFFIKMWWGRIKGFKRMKDLGKIIKTGLKALAKFMLMAMLVVFLIGLLYRYGVLQSIWKFFTTTVPALWQAVFEFFAVGKVLSFGMRNLIEGIKGLFDKEASLWESLGYIFIGIIGLLGGLLLGLIALAVSAVGTLLYPLIWPLYKFWLGFNKWLVAFLWGAKGEASAIFWAGIKTIGSWLGKVILTIGAVATVIAAAADWKSKIFAYAALATVTGAVLSYAGQMATGGIVNKTGNWLVGEQGPELVSLPQGTRVHNNANTNKMMGNNITINVQGRVGASDTELRDIARKVGRLVSQEINRTTSSSTIYR